MQDYGEVFAKVYARRWTQFTSAVAPLLKAYYENTAIARRHRTILDLCCGTGQLCNYFLRSGYTAMGVDRSQYMLAQATKLNRRYIERGVARFVAADVSRFKTARRFGLVVSTFDSLNHLEGMPELSRCIAGAHRASLPGASFIFDLNTREGLKRWAGLEIREDEELTLISRGIYTPGMERAYIQISGFFRTGKNRYQKFDEVFYNTAFDLEEVRRTLLEKGFASVRFAAGRDLAQILQQPEKEGRVFVVARR
jgi:SAM-dependent methyltransferase